MRCILIVVLCIYCMKFLNGVGGQVLPQVEVIQLKMKNLISQNSRLESDLNETKRQLAAYKAAIALTQVSITGVTTRIII